MNNKIIFDWLAFTVHGMQVNDVVELIGFSSLIGDFVNGRGYNGYQDRLYFESISIHYNGKDNQGIHVEMSGQGCRAFESYSELPDFESLLSRVFSIEKYKITRVDIAYDDFNNCLPIGDIVDSVKNGEWLSPSNMQWWESCYSSAGLSCYIGSPRSNIRFRFYDKAAEQKTDYQWTRLEIQLRDADATYFLQKYFFENISISDLFFGVVNRYVKFINLDNSRKTRCSVKGWWSEFLETDKIVKLESPGITYNISNLLNTIDRAGNSLQTYINIFGVSSLLTYLDQDKPIKKMPKKFKDLLGSYISDYAAAREGKFDEIIIDGDIIELEREIPLRMKNALNELNL